MNVKTATIRWLIFILLFPFLSFGQTKKETEEWLTYYLNKYFSSYTLGMPDAYRGIRHSGSYDFSAGMLNHYHVTYMTLLPNSIVDSMMSEETERIHFNRVHKIYFETDSLNYNGFEATITMDFDINSNQDITVEIYDKSFKLKEARTQVGYVFISTDEALLKDNLLDRIKKALEHYSTLSGAKLLKEVF